MSTARAHTDGSGPGTSDTGNAPAGVFPAGSYAVTVTVTLPGLGAVSASLPITVTD